MMNDRGSTGLPTNDEWAMLGTLKAAAERMSGHTSIFHSVIAAVLTKDGTTHLGINLHHYTGGPCAELTALATARLQSNSTPICVAAFSLIDRRLLAPCGKDRQIFIDYAPSIRVLIESRGEVRAYTPMELTPHAERWVPEVGMVPLVSPS